MDLLRPIVRHLTYDLFLSRDGYDVRPARRLLARSQHIPATEIQSLQRQRLRDILEYAFHNNPFHHDRFVHAGVRPTDIRDPDILRSLPIMTKEDLRRPATELFSRHYGPESTIHKRTGGSTGVPIHVYVDFPAMAFKKAVTERHNRWAGLRPGDRIACVWGDTDKREPLRSRVRNALTQRAIYLDTLHFSPERIEAFLAEVSTWRPRILLGHAHSVFRLAEYVRDHEIAPYRYAGVITTAMTLSPGERQVIQQVFGSPVFDRYGCEEISLIASECEAHEGLHIASEGVLVEVLGDHPGGVGRIVITDLANRAMPLIRYDIGDYGRLAPGICPCGRSLPRLQEVSGRIADFLYTPEGEPVFGISILDTFMIHIPGIKQIQIIQDRFDHLDIHIVQGASFDEKTLTRLGAAITTIFGSAMRYDLRYFDAIELTEAGKYRFSICRIPELARSEPVI